MYSMPIGPMEERQVTTSNSGVLVAVSLEGLLDFAEWPKSGNPTNGFMESTSIFS